VSAVATGAPASGAQAESALLERIRQHKAGRRVGVYSVCSAHPLVLASALALARRRGSLALIESTSNQVNQEGGYTGMRPAAFRELVLRLAAEAGLPPERVVLGGDHLGPNCWQSLPAAEALARAATMVDEYVAAGFRKIHLDCSMSCAGDPPRLDDGQVAGRAAALCAVAERSWQQHGGTPPVYVIGTEVPPPGGARESLHELQVTRPEAALATLATHREAFGRAGLQAAWGRVIGLVVQPGVEFDHHEVVDYRPERARALSACLDGEPGIVFEAHSTDYQPDASLAALVRDHFAILKVGPAATFALREALWALDALAGEWLGTAAPGLRATVISEMRADPVHWRSHYHSTGAALELDLQYSLSDRVRYYWTRPKVGAAVERLERALDSNPPPLALLGQHLPRQFAALRAGRLAVGARGFMSWAVQAALEPYALACEVDLDLA
jgi:D-tagatose-1,6-bisphosphate aldolase subunit GatZ/KbaZ